MKKRYSVNSLPVTPWKNGGGETREIIAIPSPQAEFSWRASIATLSQSGPFSSFPGVDRTITLLSGSEVTLEIDQQPRRLRQWQPVAFAGEQSVFCHVGTEPSQDFNIMVARAEYRAEVSVTAAAATATEGVCLVLRGRWRAGDDQLAPAEGIYWRGQRVTLEPDSEQAMLLFVALIPQP
ncbi:HutD/Ves family protein [Pantoea sp. A4]|uniref:HutD/Ves family protein n=1 Tax=Pantoea sp. A4 TaxID=1225184 RepID=UPI00037325DB|nr:HutD family protein [Pantoea sp. A4]